MVIRTFVERGRDPCRFLTLSAEIASMLTLSCDAGCQIAERLRKIGVRLANDDFFMGVPPFLVVRW
jgi:hypothetical protein